MDVSVPCLFSRSFGGPRSCLRTLSKRECREVSLVQTVMELEPEDQRA